MTRTTPSQPTLNDRLAHGLTHYRHLLALVTVGLCILLAAGGSRIYMDTDYRIFFKPDNPYLVANDFIEASYIPGDNVAFIVSTRQGDLFTPKHLAALEYMTEKAWQLPYALRVDSLTNYQHTWSDDDSLIVEDLFADAASLSPEAIAEKREIALNEKTLVRNIIAEDGRTTMINVRLALPELKKGELDKDREVVAAARLLQEAFAARFPDLEFHLFGMVTVNNAFNEMSERDSQVLMPWLFVLIFTALILFFRLAGSSLPTALQATFITTLVIVASLAGAIGATGWLDIPLNAVNAIAPTIILTLAVADCVHLLFNYINSLRMGHDRVQAMEESLRLNLQPVFLTSLTTAIGFVSLNFSDTPPFHSLGNITAMGITLAFLLSVAFLPSIATLLPMKAARSANDRSHIMETFADHVIRHQKTCFWSVLLLVLFSTSFISRNQLNDSTVTFFDESVPFRQAALFFQENLTGYDNIAWSISSGESNGIHDPAFLAKVDQFCQWLEQQDGVSFVGTYTDVIKRLNLNMHGDRPEFYRLPASREEAAQYHLLYELSLPPGMDLNTLVNVDKSAVLVNISVRNKRPDQLIEMEEQFTAYLKEQFPELQTTAGSSVSIMFAHMGQRNIEGMVIGNLLALVLITLTLVLALHSVRYGLLSLIPNMVPPLVTVGLWGLFSGEVNLAVALVFVITLGIVVDDTVHFLSKYLRARREKNLDTEAAIRYAFSTVGNALVITSSVLAAGFLVLAQSHFMVNAIMGLMVAVTIVIALLFDFLFLPALLLKLDKSR